MSSEAQQAEQLAQAIVLRAEALAEEQRRQTQQTVARIQTESQARVQRLENRESGAAKAEAERAYHRQVQAGELRLQAELDRLRWDLVQQIMARLETEMAQFAADRERYPAFLRGLVRSAAAAIERDTLLAEVNRRDYQDLQADITQLGAGKQIQLIARDNAEWLGGVLMYSEDRRIRIDNTLQGRLQQRQADIQQAVLAKLFPAGDYRRLLFS